jgi:two-component system chemotaxis response regulator CheY
MEYSHEELKGIDKNGKSFRVLVVEDEMGTQKLIAQILKSAFYDVVGIASDGKMAVAKYKTLKPDLVTMDVKMPLFNGYQALKEILEFDPEAHILMLTHEDSKDTVVRILKGGARDYLLKPVERIKLLAKLRKIRRDLVSKSRYLDMETIDFVDKMEEVKNQVQKEEKAEEIKLETTENAPDQPAEEKE